MDFSVLMGLGRGLETFGQQYGQMHLLRQQREAEEQRRKEERERSDRAMDNLLSQFALQQGLEDPDALQHRASGLSAAGMATSVMPGLAGMASDPLSQLAKQSQEDLTRGRRITLTDSQGRARNYVQPFSRTADGRAELDRRQSATERAQVRESLIAAGFTPAQAEALSTASGPQVFSALLSQFQPKKAMTPWAEQGFDTEADYLAFKGREAAATDRGDNGGQRYNNAIVTDEATGERFLVDPRTGQTVGTVKRPDGTPIRDVPQAVREQVAGIDDVLSNLNVLESLVDKYGIENMPGQAKSDLASAYAATQLGYKEAARLGAITGPDMQIIEGAIPNPTSVTARFGAGSKGVLAGIQRVRQQMQNRRKILESRYGVTADSTYSGLR